MLVTSAARYLSRQVVLGDKLLDSTSACSRSSAFVRPIWIVRLVQRQWSGSAAAPSHSVARSFIPSGPTGLELTS